MLLGYQRLKRWLALLLATASKDVNLRPVMFAAVRRGLLMEELVAGNGDEETKGEMFICGVFSLLDRMFQQSFAKLLGSIPVPERVYQALVRNDGPVPAVPRDGARRRGRVGVRLSRGGDAFGRRSPTSLGSRRANCRSATDRRVRRIHSQRDATHTRARGIGLNTVRHAAGLT